MLLERFAQVVDRNRVHVLDIADDYQLMDPELVELLRSRVAAVLARMS